MKKAEGYYICYGNAKTTQYLKGNLFQCKNEEYISSLFVHDGFQDCNEQYLTTSSDETCILIGHICQLKCKEKNCKCSPLHFKSRGGSCKSYIDTALQTDTFDTDVSNANMFNCSENVSIKYTSTNDLIPDCGPAAEDEPLLKNLLLNNVHIDCAIPGQIPCRDGHPKCFNITDICIYKLDMFNHLSPCRTGGHMESCTQFECNIHFKCPGFYCIPWSYVCDGKWDCPYEYDEKSIHKCGAIRQCKNMFRCKESHWGMMNCYVIYHIKYALIVVHA